MKRKLYKKKTLGMFPMQWRCSSSTALCEVVISFQVLFPYQTTVGFKLHNYDMGLVILSDEYFATCHSLTIS